MTMTVSHFSLNFTSPCSALCILAPSNLNGNVIVDITIAPISFAMPAMTGEAPVPVPPPMPAVRNIKSMSFSRLFNSALLSKAALAPVSG